MLGKVGAVLAPLGFGLLAIVLLGAAGANAVTDAAPPSLTLPAAATTNATSSRGAVVSFIAVATDDVGPTSLVCAPASGTRFAVGATTVTCTAMDAASHSTSATFTITVLSASEQLALLRTGVVALRIDPGVQQGLLDKLDAAKLSILAGQSKIACNQLNAFANQVRAQTAKAIADNTDLLRRQNEIEAALDCVPSKAPPVLLGPRADVTTNTAPGLPTAIVRFTGPSSSITCAPTSPATLALGANTVQCTATDANGTTRRSFVVTVVDLEKPILTLPSDVTVTAPAGSSSAVVSYTATATDNVPGVRVACTPASGTTFAYGTTTVTCTATDTSGNTATGTFHVTVNFAISGRITDRSTGMPLAGVTALVADAATRDRIGTSTSGADGTFSIVTSPGRYRVVFNGDSTVAYTREWWNRKNQFELADVVTVSGSVGGIDAALVPGVFVRGQVTDESTHLGIAGVQAGAFDPAAPCCQLLFAGSPTDAAGNYVLVVPAGTTAKIQFVPGLGVRYLGEWWDNKRSFDTATVLTFTGNTTLNAELTPAVVISGRVSDDQTHAGLGSIGVAVTDSTTPCCPFGNITFSSTESDGTYSVLVPKDKPVKINFFPFGSADPHYIGEWFDDRPNWDSATIRSFTGDTSGINAGLSRGLFISGHVTRHDNTPIEGVFANANDGLAGCCHFITGSRTDRNGDYHILVRPGTYKVLFFSRPGFLAADGVTYIDQWWNGAPFFEQGNQIVVTTLDVGGINAVMARAVIVSGHVTDATGAVPVAGFQVNALDASGPCCQFVGGAQTDANGDYSIAVPPGLTIKVDFGVFSGPPPGTRYLPEWWNAQTSFEDATPIPATADVQHIDARLATGFLITGRVTERGSGAALADVHVQVIDPASSCCPFRLIRQTETSATGDYALVLSAGSYKVQFFEFPPPAVRPHINQWWQNKPFDQGADLLVVAGDRSGIDAALPLAVFISGTVTNADASAPVVGLNVSAQDASLCCQFVGGGQTDASGNYRFPVPAGSSVKVEFGVFSAPSPGTRYVGQWWDNKPDFGVATTINALTDVSGINARLASGFVLSGHVSNASGSIALAGVGVNVNDATLPCCQFIVGTQTDALGNYQVIVPAGRRIRVFFGTNPVGGVRYLPQWWNNKPFFDGADDIAMTQDRNGIDAHLATGVLIHGRVTDATGAVPVVGLNVSAQDATQNCCQFVGGSQTDLDGRYTMVVPSGHDVKIEFGVFNGPPPGTRYLPEWYNDAPSFDTATAISTATDRDNIDASLDQGFVISGQVRAPGGAVVPNAFVGASLGGAAPCCTGAGGTNTDPTGHYRLVLRAGTYRINVNFPPERHLVGQWWAGVPGGTAYFQRATDIVLGPADAPDRDFDVQAGSVIRGHVSDAATGLAVGGFGVTANDALIPCCEGLAFTGTDPMGNYFLVVPVGRPVRVFFGGGPASPYTAQWWNNKPDFGIADMIDTTIDQPAIDAHLARGFLISGHVTERGGGALSGIHVSVIDAASFCCPFREVSQTQTNATGDYSVSVPAGTYKVEFSEFPPPARPHMYQWWPDKRSDQDATPIVVTADRPGIDAALERAVFIRGHVSDAIAPSSIPGTFVAAWDATVGCCTNFTGDITDSSGNYSVIAPLGSQVKVGFGPPSGSRYLPQFWNNQPSFETATTINATADQDHIDAQLHQGFVISGTVTGPSGPASLVQVNATRGGGASCCQGAGQTSTDAAGHYQLTVPAGTYRINVTAPPAFRVVTQWWNGVPGGTAYFERATDITVGPGDAPGKDFTIVYGSLIEGRVTASVGGAGLSGIGVTANDASGGCCEGLAFGGTDSSGSYSLIVPRGRLVKVFFGPGPGSPYLSQWWNGANSFEAAQIIETSFDRSGINAQLSGGVTISGHVTDVTGSIVISGLNVSAQDGMAPCCRFVGAAQVDVNGNYRIVVPVGAKVKIEFGVFNPPPPSTHFVGQWWNNKSTFETADLITANADVPNINALLAGSFTLTGRVTERGTGTPLAGVHVQPFDASGACCSEPAVGPGTVTDVNGNYSLNLPGGRYKLYFFESPLGNPPHYPQWWSNHVSSSRANVVILFADTSEANVELASAVFISGLVTDASDGLPIAGVNVAAMLPTLPCCEIVDNAQTDATGNYRFMAPLGASLKIQFIGSGHITEWWDNKPFFDSADLLVADSNKSGVNAQLARATANSVSGRVTDRATGLPIAGMNVQLDLANVCCQAIGFGAVTDSDGRYTVTLDAPATVKVLFFRVPGGPPYVLRWYHDKDDFNLADSLVVSGAVADVDEVLDAGIVISGQVTDAATAAALLNITVIAQPNFGCCGYGSNTDANGRYNLVVGPGTYRISFFSPPGSDYLEQWWNNKPGYSAADLLTVPSTTVDLTSINAAFVHGILVRGTVTGAAGAAVGQVDVVATLDDPAIPCCLSYRAQTGTDGTYTMYVRAGHYRINFQPPSTTDYLAEYWDGKPDFGSASVLNVVGSTEGIDASLDRGFRITGRVTDANGGAGVPNVFVGVNDVICCTSGGYGFTGADGTYSATVRAGTYTLAFNPPFGSDFVLQYWNNKPTLGTANHLVVDASKPNIDAVLGHGFRLAGRISDAGDPAIPLPGANVSAYTVGTFEFVANAAAGSDGTYSLFVPAGDYDLYFNPPYLSDYVGEYWNDKIDQASADVVHVAGPISGLNAGLARAVRISGRVTDETGAPATSVFVSVHKPDAPFAYVTGSSTDDAGRYSVPLSPGSYKMCFFPSYGSPLLPECWNDKENSLAAADPIDVTSSVAGFDVVLARGIVISGRVTSTSGVPLSGAVALIAHGEEACCNFYLGYQTQANGTYSITIAPGSYFVGFSATGYQFQYWNGKTNALTADLLSGAIDHPNTDAALAPIDASPPAGSGPPADGSPPGSSGPPSDGTPPAGSSAPTDGTPGAGSVVADDRTIAMGLPSPSIGAQWSVVMTT